MLQMIRTAGVFMIIAQTMYHFVSGSKYARYVRLLIQIMTLAVLIVPLLDLVKSGTEADFHDRLVRFEQEYEAILQDAEYTQTGMIEGKIEQITARELQAMVDPALVPYGYETVSVYAEEDRLLFLLRSFSAREAGVIEVRPVREVNIQVGGTESDGEQPDEGDRENEAEKNGVQPGLSEEERWGRESAAQAEAELAGVIAAYLRVERSWVEVRIVES